MARRATLIRQEREKSQRVLVLEAGNWLANDREPALTSRGRTSVQAMNLMGYDAAALGLLDITKLGLAELQARMAEAAFPILSANATVVATGDLLAQPYKVFEIDGRRIGVLGLTDPGSTAEIHVTDPLEAIRRWLPEVQQEADIIILLSHAGLTTDQRIVEELDGIDVVIGGRDGGYQKPLTVAGSLLLRADEATSGNAAKHVGLARLYFDDKGTLSDYEWQQVALGPELEDDPQMVEWLSRTNAE